MPLTEQTLLNQIAAGEDSGRRFKSDAHNAESLAAEPAALANSQGGVIYLGYAARDGFLGKTKA